MVRPQPYADGSASAPTNGRTSREPGGLQVTGNLALSLPERPHASRRSNARERAPSAKLRSVTNPVHRAIVAVDMEGSTRRTNPIKEELRRRTYQLFDEALYAAGIEDHHLDRLTDRGDGVLALVRPADEVPKTLLLDQLIPTLSALLFDHNCAASRPKPSELQLRLRAVVHAGEVHDDGKGFFGEALDVAFRLLDAPPVKKVLRLTAAPLVLVVSEEIFWSIVWQGYDGIDGRAYEPLVRVQVAGRRRQGWVHVPGEPPERQIRLSQPAERAL
jgi:class 3 adenylate cyclase